jgi:Mrp family chromosome partitioning ATPase
MRLKMRQEAGLAGAGKLQSDSITLGRVPMEPTVRTSDQVLHQGSVIESAMDRAAGVLGADHVAVVRSTMNPDRGASSLPIGRSIAPPRMTDVAPYEALAANLWARQEQPSRLKTLLVIGANRHGSVSAVAANLATALVHQQTGSVLLAHAGTRVPSMSASASEPTCKTDLTLEQLLTSKASLQPPDEEGSSLHVICSGTDGGQAAALFQSQAFVCFLRAARDLFRAVIVDAPHPTSHPETLLLCRQVDGVVLVVESEQTPKQSALWVSRQVEECGGRLLGVVLTRRRFRIPAWIYKRL